jgi:hypothetical protein
VTESWGGGAVTEEHKPLKLMICNWLINKINN